MKRKCITQTTPVASLILLSSRFLIAIGYSSFDRKNKLIKPAISSTSHLNPPNGIIYRIEAGINEVNQ